MSYIQYGGMLSKCGLHVQGILPIERPADIETGEFNKHASLVYMVGHTSPSGNFKLYTSLVSATAHMFLERCKAKPASKRQPL